MTDTHADSAARERWVKPRFGYCANRFMLWVGARFLPLGYVLIWFAALYFFLFVARARRASVKYLDRMDGEKRSFLRRYWQTYRHMVAFGLLLLDRALILAGPGHRFRITADGLGNLRQALDRQAGLLLLTAHFGNAEAAAPYMAEMGMERRMHLVMYQDPADSTERFHMRHRRMLAGVEIISTIDPLVAGVKIIRALRQNDVVAIRADRALDGRTIGATLLGARVWLPAGPFLAAALSGAPVVYVYTARVGYRRYTCVMSAPRFYGDSEGGTRDERARRAAEDYAGFLEKMVLDWPLQWGNFYDFWGA